METAKLPRAKEMAREPHNIVLEVSHPARRLVLESRNVWSPARGVPPIVRGFTQAETFSPGFPELPEYPRREEQRVKTPLGGVISRLNSPQLGYTTDKKTAFSQVLMGSTDMEDAKRVVLRSRVGHGFSPERVVKVLKDLDVIKEPPRRLQVQQSPIKAAPVAREEFKETSGPNYREVEHFYPGSFCKEADGDNEWAATQSLAQAYGKRANMFLNLRDAVPRRVPGGEFSLKQSGATHGSPMRQPQYIKAHQAKTNTLNQAAQRLEEVNKRNTDAAGMAFKVAGFLYEGQQTLHVKVAEDLEQIVLNAFVQDSDPEKNDVATRAVGLLIEQNAVGKIKSFTLRLLDGDLLRQNQIEFQAVSRIMSGLLQVAPQTRDAFCLNGFLDSVVGQIATIFSHSELYLRNTAYFHSLDFLLTVPVICRLYYPAAKVLLPQIAEILKYLVQQFVSELQKPIDEVKRKRRQYQDDILDEESFDEFEDLPNYITPEIKGALLNQLIKASRAESAMEIMLSQRHEQQLIQHRHGKQAKVFSDVDSFCWLGFNAQQAAFAWLQHAYADGNKESMLQLTQLLSSVVESLNTFSNVCKTYREKQIDLPLHTKLTAYQSFIYKKLQALSPNGQYVAGEVVSGIDYNAKGDALTDQIRMQLQSLL